MALIGLESTASPLTTHFDPKICLIQFKILEAQVRIYPSQSDSFPNTELGCTSLSHASEEKTSKVGRRGTHKG